MPEQQHDRWLTTVDVAKELDTGVEPVRRLIIAGKLKATKIGRSYKIKKSNLDKYLKELEEEQT